MSLLRVATSRNHIPKEKQSYGLSKTFEFDRAAVAKIAEYPAMESKSVVKEAPFNGLAYHTRYFGADGNHRTPDYRL
jgi:hypothetical protein